MPDRASVNRRFRPFLENLYQRGWPIAFQSALILALGYVCYRVGANVADGLARQSIATGFGFLDEKAGFSIIQSLISYSEQSSYGRVFWVGLLNTLLVAALGIVIATLVGFTMGFAGLSRNWLARTLSAAYVDIMRNLPLLLHLFFWYFAVLRHLPPPRRSFNFGETIYLNNRGLYLPELSIADGGWFLGLLLAVSLLLGLWLVNYRRNHRHTKPNYLMATGLCVLISLAVFAVFMGFRLNIEPPVLKGFNFRGGVKIIPELAALTLALGLYTAGYIAEIVRAGMASVAPGQMEAGRILGLTRRQTMRKIILPQALRVIVPLLTSQYLNLTKNSSLAVAIAYPDLVSVFAGTTLNQTGQAVEILLITLGVYLCLSLLTAAVMNWFNARHALKGGGAHG